MIDWIGKNGKINALFVVNFVLKENLVPFDEETLFFDGQMHHIKKIKFNPEEYKKCVEMMGDVKTVAMGFAEVMNSLERDTSFFTEIADLPIELKCKLHGEPMTGITFANLIRERFLEINAVSDSIYEVYLDLAMKAIPEVENKARKLVEDLLVFNEIDINTVQIKVEMDSETEEVEMPLILDLEPDFNQLANHKQEPMPNIPTTANSTLDFPQSNHPKSGLADKVKSLFMNSSLMGKTMIIAAVISVLFILIGFLSGHRVAGIVAIIQTAFFAGSWAVIEEIIPSPQEKAHIYMPIAGAVCAAIVIMILKFGAYPTLVWPSGHMASQIPKPSTNKGEVNHSTDEYISVDLYNVSSRQFLNYVKKCKQMGYADNVSEDSDWYRASSGDEYDISIRYDSKKREMSITAKEKEDETSYKVSEKETKDATQHQTEHSTEKETKKESSSNSGVTPELKAFLDSYEAYMDEYVAFMKKYSTSDDMLSMMGDYYKMMTKLEEFSKKAEAYDQDKMSDADLKYYTEVMLRIEGKMLNAIY